MRDSLITLAGALLSLFLLVSLLSPAPVQRQSSRPTTEDDGKHGLMAAYRWLAENNVNVFSLRKPFSRIDQEDLPVSGNLMILSLPLVREVLDSEWETLNEWISRGNSVLVAAGIYHLPQWSKGEEWYRETEIISAVEAITAEQYTLSHNEIEKSTKGFDLAELQRSIQAFKPSTVPLRPATEHALFREVTELRSWHTAGLYQDEDQSGTVANAYWSVDSESSRLALRLMFAETRQQTAMWLLPVGQGWVYLSAFPDLVSNRVLNDMDNARWFANLLALTVADEGYVIFDDYHFGLSDLYDPEAFFSDKRLHNTLWFIGAFWLIYALGRRPRLAPLKQQERKLVATDFIEATAGFVSRRVKARAIAQYLAARLLQALSQRTQLEGEALWHWLHDHPAVSTRDIYRLQRATGYASGSTKLVQLTRSIDRIHKVIV